ncbi:BnaC07g50320D [Brassica napus]|uniref:BnaC07g50320D protein n=1 Tax=Brassica napus TaxID=3708 RepID=A0A078J0C6_BRANA|nr:BnaC07g50320D [Brassica napus]
MAFLRTNSLCFFLFTVLLSFSTFFTDARRFEVGGSGAWVPNPPENYGSWAGKSRFLVHDTLYFSYAKGMDSVLEVNKADYDGCNTKNPIKKVDDGASEISLERSGPFYFISGNEDNCKKGQKLTVVVLSVRTPSPPQAAAPGNSPPGSMPPTSSSHVSPATSPPAHTPPKSSSPVTPSSAPVTSPPGSMPPKSSSHVSPATSPPAHMPPKSTSPVSPSSAPVTSPPGSMPPKSSSPVSPSSAPVNSPPGSMPPKSSSAKSPATSPPGSMAPKSSSHMSPATSPPRTMPPKSSSPDAPSGSAMGPSGDAPSGSAMGPSASGNITSPSEAPGEEKASANGMAVMSVTTVLSLVIAMFMSA